MKLKKLLSLLVLFSLIITGCGGTQQPPTLTGDPNVTIVVEDTATESKEIGTETVSQDNCTGIAEVESTVEKSRTIEHVMEVQNEMSVNASGQVGFAGIGVELGATVASQFGQSYGTSETITHSITVKAPAGTHMQHRIRQSEVWTTGKAKIIVGGQQTIIPFKFRSGFAIDLAGSNQLTCDSNGTTSEGAQASPTQENPPSVAATATPIAVDVQLVTNSTSGKAPLTVDFDARGSFLREANGNILGCSVCNYTWYVYKNSQLINDPDRSGNGTFRYRFGAKGDYRVVVRVCRGKGDSDCGYDAENISVQ